MGVMCAAALLCSYASQRRRLGSPGLRAARGAVRAPVRARVIVIGGGFAGAACALQLRQLQPALEVRVVDPDDAYVTCPMSNAALVGLRTIDSLTVSAIGSRTARGAGDPGPRRRDRYRPPQGPPEPGIREVL